MLNRYGNRDLFLNMVNWMSSDEDLISIRPKEPEDRRLTVKPTQFWVLYVTSFLPALERAGGRHHGLAEAEIADGIPGD